MLRFLATLLLVTQTPLSADEKSRDADLVKQLLNEDLGTRSFSFSEVIHSSSGKKVVPFDANNKLHQQILKLVQQSALVAISQLNDDSSPTNGLRRINEASRILEDHLLTQLNTHKELDCTIPTNTQGRKQRSGYPDIRIQHKPSGLVIYLDPKLFEKKSRASSFRTFYFEPRKRTIKVQDDAIHLLLGVSHDGNDGNWTFGSPEFVDLSKLRVRLKAEFQASNRDLYRKALIIPTPNN